jgi:hypothetical protein
MASVEMAHNDSSDDHYGTERDGMEEKYQEEECTKDSDSNDTVNKDFQKAVSIKIQELQKQTLMTQYNRVLKKKGNNVYKDAQALKNKKTNFDGTKKWYKTEVSELKARHK